MIKVLNFLQIVQFISLALIQHLSPRLTSLVDGKKIASLFTNKLIKKLSHADVSLF